MSFYFMDEIYQIAKNILWKNKSKLQNDTYCNYFCKVEKTGKNLKNRYLIANIDLY